MNNRLAKLQQGLSLVMAVFVLVVLSLLGAAMINIIAGGTESVAREVISTRTLFAAESGAQRTLGEIFPPGAAAIPGNCVVGPVINPASYLAGIVGCSNLTVTISCIRREVSAVNYYTISSTASCGPVNEKAVRTVEVQAKDV